MGNLLGICAAVGAILALSQSTPEDAQKRNAALAKLIRQKSPDAAAAVIDSLTDPDAGVRQLAVANLDLAAANPQLVPRLRQLLRNEPPESRWLAVRAASSIPAAFLALRADLERLASDPDPLIRKAVLAHVEKGDGILEAACPMLLAAVARSEPVDRMSAAQSIARIGCPADTLVDQIIRDLRATEEAPGGAASYALTALWNPRVERGVRAALDSPDLLQRGRAADTLRKRKQPFDPEVLALVYGKGSEQAQFYACGVLSRVQTPACSRVLGKALASRFPRVRQAAVYALEVTPGSEAALIDALRHADANVRHRAAIVLGRTPASRAAATPLQKLAAGDPDERVRSAAAIAAALISGESLAPVLADPSPALKMRPSPTPVGAALAFRDGAAVIGSNKQLVADGELIENPGGARRIAHRFRKDPNNPVIEQQLPWEVQGVTNYCTTVEYDASSGLYRLWYLSYWRVPELQSNPFNNIDKARTQLLAYSRDGVNWLRPNLGAFAFRGEAATNLVGSSDNLIRLPDSRYASFAPMRKDGKHFLAISFSPDGIRDWSAPEPVTEIGGDVGTVMRDDLRGGYLGFTKWAVNWWLGESFGEKYDYGRRALLKLRATGFRSFAPMWGKVPRDLSRGEVNLAARAGDDRVAPDVIAAHWPALDFVTPGDIHSEVYQVVAFPYEGHYFAFPVVFSPSGRGGANDDGPTGLSMVFSRDPLGRGGWVRPAGEHLAPVLDHERWGEWDSTQLYGPSNLVVAGDEIVLYYNAAPHGHEPEGAKSDSTGNRAYRSAIGRATMRLDGMISLRAGAEETAITTKPLLFEGDSLEVNASCARGSLRAELLDRDGRPVKGFEVSQSMPFLGDSVRHIMTWRGGEIPARLRNGPVRLRLYLKNGDLFAFRFVSNPGRKQ